MLCSSGGPEIRALLAVRLAHKRWIILIAAALVGGTCIQDMVTHHGNDVWIARGAEILIVAAITLIGYIVFLKPANRARQWRTSLGHTLASSRVWRNISCEELRLSPIQSPGCPESSPTGHPRLPERRGRRLTVAADGFT